MFPHSTAVCSHLPPEFQNLWIIQAEIQFYKGNKGRCKESTIRKHRKNLSPRWDSNPRRVVGRGFESHLGLRFFLCPLMVDSLHLPLFPLWNSISPEIWKYRDSNSLYNLVNWGSCRSVREVSSLPSSRFRFHYAPSRTKRGKRGRAACAPFTARTGSASSVLLSLG